MKKTLFVLAALIIVGMGFLSYRWLNRSTLAERLLLPVDYMTLPTHPCEFHDFNLTCADFHGMCWYRPFPCVPSSKSYVERRGPHLEDGFRQISP